MSWWWLLPAAAYLLGSVSFAWFAGRLNGVDLRQHGSKSLGATNAGRVLGRKWFFIVFAGDVAKGMLAIAAAKWVPVATGTVLADAEWQWLLLATAAGVVLGHSFTCFHGFKGGKAVATSLGVLALLLPLVAGICLGLWLVAWAIGWLVFGAGKSNAVGPASVLAALCVPVAHLLTSADPWQPAHLPLSLFTLLLGALVTVLHRKNLARLFAGIGAARRRRPRR